MKMDMSKLPKIRDEERESQFGYVHGVSGPGRPPWAHIYTDTFINKDLVTFELQPLLSAVQKT